MRPIETCVDDTNERLYIFIIVKDIADVNPILQKSPVVKCSKRVGTLWVPTLLRRDGMLHVLLRFNSHPLEGQQQNLPKRKT